MPTRMTNKWLARVARGLTSGALALTVLSGSGGILPASTPRLADADEIGGLRTYVLQLVFRLALIGVGADLDAPGGRCDVARDAPLLTIALGLA